MPPDPDEIRRALFDAIAGNDVAAFTELYAAQQTLILKYAISWAKVPDAYRNPQTLNWYAQGLITLAQELARQGHPELLNHLTSTKDNVIADWQAALRRVDQHSGEGRFREAADEARRTLERVKGLLGPAAEELRSITLGRLGQCLFNAGDVEEARQPFTQALQGCTAQHDVAGMGAYLGSLSELHRYLGESQAAAECLERSAGYLEQLGKTSVASARRRQAAIVRAGEPLCRVVVDVAGEELEIDDVPVRESGHFKLNFRRNRRHLGATMVAVNTGIREAQAGNGTRALQFFEQAARIDRFDPSPHLHTGSTLCYLGRYSEAVTAFARTEALAPGFFQVRSDLWLAQQIASGAVSQDTFLIVRFLSDNSPEPDEAAQRALDALRTTPIAALYLFAGDAFGKLGRKSEAEAHYRRGLASAGESDVHTRLLLALSSVVADPAERASLLHEAARLRGNLVAAATAELALRSGRKALH